MENPDRLGAAATQLHLGGSGPLRRQTYQRPEIRLGAPAFGIETKRSPIPGAHVESREDQDSQKWDSRSHSHQAIHIFLKKRAEIKIPLRSYYTLSEHSASIKVGFQRESRWHRAWERRVYHPDQTERDSGLPPLPNPPPPGGRGLWSPVISSSAFSSCFVTLPLCHFATVFSSLIPRSIFSFPVIRSRAQSMRSTMKQYSPDGSSQ